MISSENKQVAQAASADKASRFTSDESKGMAYELGLFMYLLTHEKLKNCDFGKEVKIADKFDDLVIRLGQEYTCIQAKLVNNPQKNLIDSDVLLGKKQIALHRNAFDLRKYFISYLRVKDQLNSRNDESILKKLIIFTNAKPINRLLTTTNENAIVFIPSQSDENNVPKIHQDAKHYKVKQTVEVLKDHLKKYLKPDLEILSEELAKYIVAFDEDYFKCYYKTLIDCGVIELNNEKEAKFTQKFSDNNLENSSETAKNVRNRLEDFILKNNYGNIDELDLKERFKKAKLPVYNVKNLGKYAPNLTSSDLLLQELAKHVTPLNKCMQLDNGYLKYYHTALIDENILLETKKNRVGKFTQNFINNDDTLSNAAKKLRDFMPRSISEHAQKLKKYLEEALCLETNVQKKKNLIKCLDNIEILMSDSADSQKLKEYLKNVTIQLSTDFGQKKRGSSQIFLPNYEIKNESVNDFLGLLEFRVNEHGVRELFHQIKNKEIKERFLSSYDIDPELIEFLVNRSVKEWKNSGGSSAEGWILNFEREKFIHDLESNISKSKAGHKTREYTHDLNKKVEEFDIHFNDRCSFKETSFQSAKKAFFIKTDSTLLTSIKMLAYLKERKLEDYIFINVESLMIKEEVKELIQKFRVDDFKLLILSYASSLGDKLEEELSIDLFEIMQNDQKRIILITSVADNALIEKVENNQCEHISDETIALEHLENSLKVLEQEVVFQDQPIALKTLINQDDGLIKLIDAKTLDKIIRNEKVKIGSRPFCTSDLTGAYAQLSEEIDKKILTANLINSSPEFFYVISGIAIQDKEQAKEKFVGNLELPSDTDIEKNKHTIISKIDILTHPYSIPSTVKAIQLVDSGFEDGCFKDFCVNHSDKKVFWIKWEKSKFNLQQIYNPDFYVKRKFNKVIIKENVKEAFQQRSVDQFVFSGVQDQVLAQFLGLEMSKIDEKRVFFTPDSVTAKKKFKELSNTVHWLEVEKNSDHHQIVWRDSKGSLDNLRKYVDEYHPGNSDEESEFIEALRYKQAVIIADEPGMGKSTTLVKLCGSESVTNGILASHWVINVNLSDHLQAIRDIGGNNINTVKHFLSKVTPNLCDSLSQNLLEFALCENNNRGKTLLITFDGFDEVLDEVDRTKVVSLLKALKENTKAKFWVTTRLQHKKTLENLFSTFSVTFQPLDEGKQKNFIKKFFRDHSRLLLSENKFIEIFGENVEEEVTPMMHEYTNLFLEKVKSVFEENISSFIGVPLQLDLLLGSKGSIKEFKNWSEVSGDSVLNFDYVGKNILEVYENFIAGRYETYSRRTGITEKAKQNYNFKHWMFDCKNLAKSLFISKNLDSLFEHKAMVLAPGLIKSDGDNLEFIHPTFGEYFASEVYMGWIVKDSDLTNPNKQRKLLKNVLSDKNYKVIRFFINARLANRTLPLPKKTLKQYGKLIDQAFEPLPSAPYVCAKTPLHIAVKEGNISIESFLFNSIKFDKEWLKKFVRFQEKGGRNVLHMAAEKGDDDFIKKWLDPISNEIEFLTELMKTACGSNVGCGDGFEQGWTVLHLAARGGFDKTVEKLLKPFINHVEILKELIQISAGCTLNDASFPPVSTESGWTVFHLAAINGHEKVIERLLIPFAHHAEFLEELVKIRTRYRKSTALHFLACQKDFVQIIGKLLKPFANDTREQLIGIQAERGNTALHNAAVLGHDEIIEKLLRYFNGKTKEKLVEIKTESGKTVLHLAVQYGHTTIVKLLLEAFVDKKKCIATEDNEKNTSLHLAALKGHHTILNQLLTYAKNIGDNWETFKKIVKATNNDGKIAFEMAKTKSEVIGTIRKFIRQAKDENAPHKVVSLLTTFT